jgi:hypothetical protein
VTERSAQLTRSCNALSPPARTRATHAQVAGSITGIGLMYHYFGACALNQFFLSETVVLGCVLVLVSIMNAVGKGLLPPAMLFAYNTFLVYGAITNNPDTSCNLFAASENQSACGAGRRWDHGHCCRGGAGSSPGA